MTEALLREYHAARWRRLAERRLEHVADLLISGRWSRYFAERDFLEIVRQSKALVETWQKLAPPGLGEDRSARLLGVLDAALATTSKPAAPKQVTAGAPPLQAAVPPSPYEPAVVFPAPRIEPELEPPPPLLPPSPFEAALGGSLPRRRKLPVEAQG
jgi:uncharacterized repeat protein (TIGR03809 family)